MATKLAIPQTVAEMQEIMNTPAKAAEWIQSGQFSELQDAYNQATRPTLADQVTEQLQAFFDGNSVVENKVETALNKFMSERGVPNRPFLATPEGFGAGAKLAASHNKLAPGAGIDEAGFNSIGDFAQTVFNKGPHALRKDARMDKVLEVMNAYSTVDPSAGGFLIPETMRSEIYDLVLEASVVRPRASVITLTGPQSLPFVDQTTHVGSVFGGMTFQRVKASGSVSPTEAKFGRIRLDPSKLMGTGRVPNELWADAPALSTWLMAALPRGIAFFEDIDFLTGDGSGDGPLGVQNSSAAITITAETNQVASTIVTENVLKIFARVLPQSMGSGVWLANPTTFPQLMMLSIAVGTGGAPVMLMNIANGAPMTLLGRPIIFTEKVPALGSAGCLGYYDFGFYLIGDRQAVSLESSEHSRFANDETELRVITRNDGRPWIQSAITPVNGDTLSPFVMLGAVA